MDHPYVRPYKKYKRTSRAFKPGVDRTGGFYGRYSGRSGELKFHDVDLDDSIIAAGGTVTPTINIIIQGITESTRIGRKCTIKSINWKYHMDLPEQDAQMTPEASDTVRVILFLDKQANGATAVVLDILETADFQSFRNLANSGRFNVFMDKTFSINYMTLASDGAAVVSSNSVVRDYSYYKACNIPIEYSGTTGAIGEIRSNNLGVLLLSKSGKAGFQSKFRLRFSDQ